MLGHNDDFDSDLLQDAHYLLEESPENNWNVWINGLFNKILLLLIKYIWIGKDKNKYW